MILPNQNKILTIQKKKAVQKKSNDFIFILYTSTVLSFIVVNDKK